MKQLGARPIKWMVFVPGGPAPGPLTMAYDRTCVHIMLALQRLGSVHGCTEPCFSVDPRSSGVPAVLQEGGLWSPGSLMRGVSCQGEEVGLKFLYSILKFYKYFKSFCPKPFPHFQGMGRIC